MSFKEMLAFVLTQKVMLDEFGEIFSGEESETLEEFLSKKTDKESVED